MIAKTAATLDRSPKCRDTMRKISRGGAHSMRGLLILASLLSCFEGIRALVPPALLPSQGRAFHAGSTSRYVGMSMLDRSMPAAASKPILVVFDFDHTMIGCDSDEKVLALCRDADAARMRLEAAGKQRRWAACFADELVRLQQEEGITQQQIENVLKTIRLDERMKRTLHELAARLDTDVRILSDANDWFIDTILAANGISNVVSEIVTNVAMREGEVVRVLPYHTSPHPPSSTSPANLCKGRVLRHWLQQGDFKVCVYCGDGSGDFEGAMAVPRNGVILARHQWGLHERLLEATSKGNGPQAQVLSWDSQAHLASTLSHLLVTTTSSSLSSLEGQALALTGAFDKIQMQTSERAQGKSSIGRTLGRLWGGVSGGVAGVAGGLEKEMLKAAKEMQRALHL